MHARLDRAFRTPDDHGDLRQGEIFEKVQDQDFAVFGHEGVQGFMDRSGVIRREGKIGGFL